MNSMGIPAVVYRVNDFGTIRAVSEHGILCSKYRKPCPLEWGKYQVGEPDRQVFSDLKAVQQQVLNGSFNYLEAARISIAKVNTIPPLRKRMICGVRPKPTACSTRPASNISPSRCTTQSGAP